MNENAEEGTKIRQNNYKKWVLLGVKRCCVGMGIRAGGLDIGSWIWMEGLPA